MDFKQIIQVLRRRWMTIALLFVIAVGASAAYTFTATKQYQSSATIFISANMRDASDNYAATYAISTRMETYADLATSGDLLNGVISELGLDLDVRRRSPARSTPRWCPAPPRSSSP